MVIRVGTEGAGTGQGVRATAATTGIAPHLADGHILRHRVDVLGIPQDFIPLAEAARPDHHQREPIQYYPDGGNVKTELDARLTLVLRKNHVAGKRSDGDRHALVDCDDVKSLVRTKSHREHAKSKQVLRDLITCFAS